MNKKICFVSIVVSIAAIILSIVAIFVVEQKTKSISKADQLDVQYVLYVGTNDKDTNVPVHDMDTCRTILINNLVDSFGGYTLQEADGGWKDDGTIYEEHTFVVYLSDTTIEDVHKFCDKIIVEFNQSSILIQSNNTITEFYSGK